MEQTGTLKQKHAFAILDYLNFFGLTPTFSSQSLGWENMFARVFPYPGNLPPLAAVVYLS